MELLFLTAAFLLSAVWLIVYSGRDTGERMRTGVRPGMLHHVGEMAVWVWLGLAVVLFWVWIARGLLSWLF